MDEYISKQSVIDYLMGYLNSIGECGVDSLLFDRGQRRALINSIQDISVIKGADVQPVKHGRWLDNGMVYTCSECNSSVPKNIFVIGCDFEGCPYCFARMDGDSDD